MVIHKYVSQLEQALRKYDQITRVVINALERDVENGKTIRKEMLDELKACLNNACDVLDKKGNK